MADAMSDFGLQITYKSMGANGKVESHSELIPHGDDIIPTIGVTKLSLLRFLALNAAKQSKAPSESKPSDAERAALVALLVKSGIAYPGLTALIGRVPKPTKSMAVDGEEAEWDVVAEGDVKPKMHSSPVSNGDDGHDEAAPTFRSLSAAPASNPSSEPAGPVYRGGASMGEEMDDEEEAVPRYTSLSSRCARHEVVVQPGVLKISTILAILSRMAAGEGTPLEWVPTDMKDRITDNERAFAFCLYICYLLRKHCIEKEASTLVEDNVKAALDAFKSFVVRNSVSVVQDGADKRAAHWANYTTHLYMECAKAYNDKCGACPRRRWTRLWSQWRERLEWLEWLECCVCVCVVTDATQDACESTVDDV